MAGTFNLKIITPERIVLDAAVTQVTARARDGELSILPKHEPLVTALGIAPLKYWENGEEKTAAVIGGVLEVANKQAPSPEDVHEAKPHSESDLTVTVLSDAAELATEIDEARARQALQRAEAAKTQKVDKLDTQLAEMALARAAARLQALKMLEQHGRGRGHH